MVSGEQPHEQKFIEDEFCEWGLLNNKDKAL